MLTSKQNQISNHQMSSIVGGGPVNPVRDLLFRIAKKQLEKWYDKYVKPLFPDGFPGPTMG